MKKVIIATGALKPALNILGHAVNKKHVLPILNNLLCRVKGNELEAIASNTEVTIHHKIPVEAAADFEFLMPFDFIKKVVDINKNCPLEIESAAKLKIKGPTDTYDIKVPDRIEDWPVLQNVGTENSIELDSDILYCLKTAVITAQPLDAHPKLSHVLLELEPGKVVIASADGTWCVFSKEFSVDHKHEKEELLLSQRLIKVLDGIESASLTFNNEVIRFATDKITVYNTRSTERYVNFRSVFSLGAEPNLTISKSVLQDALLRCSLAQDDLHAANITLKKTGTIKLSASDHMVKINVDAQADYTCEVDRAAINTDKCMRMLSQISGQEIQFCIVDARRGFVVLDKDEPGYKGYLMPISFSNE